MVCTRTWVITIYRQTLLPGLDFADMTYTGVLATILSGVEPSVAIALACIPLCRPLLRLRSSKTKNSHYEYESNRNSQLYFNRHRRDASRKLETLDDDSSEIQLQPAEADTVQTTIHPAGRRKGPGGHAIVVEKRWEVRSE